MVTGPGQYISASFIAYLLKTPYFLACPRSFTQTAKDLLKSLPLIAYIRSIAFLSLARLAIP